MIDQLHLKYLAIWDKYQKNVDFNFKYALERKFLFQYDEVSCPDIVFVGMNPSYKGELIDNHAYNTESLVTPYFKPFQDIHMSLTRSLNREVTWTHLDLLVFRETKQSFITNELFKCPHGRQFVKDQLDVSTNLLEYYNPKVIVVSNALARRILKKETGIKELNSLGYTFEFSNNLGTDIIKGESILKGTPVFFTSMLSGQRALDVGSRKRLEWHIANVLK